MSQEQDALLTVKEVAELLKVPTSWVYDHVRPKCNDPLPCVEIGKCLRFFDQDIFRYLEAIRARSANTRRAGYKPTQRPPLSNRRDG